MAANATAAAAAAVAAAAGAAAEAAAPPPVMFHLTDLLSYTNPVFRNYCFWTAILVIKMLIMSIVTLVQRFRSSTWGHEDDTKDGELFTPNKSVERVRRAHRNDLENVIPFILISFCYTLCVPWPMIACNLFRIAGVARILHTIASIVEIPQPSRSICWGICFLITLWMAFWPLLVFIA